MSEYQYVAFQAVDRPLNEKQLEFAERQSSRAEVTRWTYNVEYHYSSFRGDVDGLLRGGYDVYLSYCNYGALEIKFRLPAGLPFSPKSWAPYFDKERLVWEKDRQGPGGILSIHQTFEDFPDPIGDYEQYVDIAAYVRHLLIEGDLRALYLLWLCIAGDDYEDPAEVIEPPVPHGLKTFPSRACELLTFFGYDPLLLSAAAQDIPDFAASAGASTDLWLNALTAQEAKQIVERLLNEDASIVKSDVVQKARESRGIVNWPCEAPSRSFADLLTLCEPLRQSEDSREQRKAEAKAKRDAAKAEKQRQARMKEMIASPTTWLDKAGQLANQRGTDNYRAAADILADMREAIGTEEGDKITRNYAADLARKYPTLKMLSSSLRKRGLLD